MEDLMTLVLVESSQSLCEVILVILIEHCIAVGKQGEELLHLLGGNGIAVVLPDAGQQRPRVEIEGELAVAELEVQELLEGSQSQQLPVRLLAVGKPVLVVRLVQVVVERVAEIDEVFPAQFVGFVAGEQVLPQPLLHAALARASSFLPFHLFVPLLSQTVVEPLHQLQQLALPPQHQLAEADQSFRLELLLGLGGEVGQVGDCAAFLRDGGVQLQRAVDALQDGVVDLVPAGHPGLGREAVFLLRVARRALGRQPQLVDGSAVLRGKGRTLPAMLRVLVPDCKRVLIFGPR